MKKGIRNEIISRLYAEGITEGPEGTLYVSHLESEGDKSRLPATWGELIASLYSEVEHYGINEVMEAANIDFLVK